MMTVPVMEGCEYWTFDLVEERLIEAWTFLMRMPDPEWSWLRSCERSGMPDIIRETRAGDEKDYDEAPRRPGLRTAEVNLVEQVLTGEAAWIMWVPERDRGLMAVALQAKGSHLVGGFTWGLVARRYGWGGHHDALRMRYNRAVSRIAGKLDAAKVTPF
ncbi:hypothetical protein BH10PSE12_BH10PSE12_02850 [soil metagenome]